MQLIVLVLTRVAAVVVIIWERKETMPLSFYKPWAPSFPFSSLTVASLKQIERLREGR